MRTNNIHFTGYDARPLKSLIIRDVGAGDSFTQLVKELSSIGNKNNFDVFVQNADEIVSAQNYKSDPMSALPNMMNFPWAQDNLTFIPKGKILANKWLEIINDAVSSFFERPEKSLEEHIQGGNFFFVKDGKSDALIVGKDELENFNLNNIKRDFEIEKVYPISQPEFHIDMGIRPLKDKTVLVNDDNLLSKALHDAVTNAKIYAEENNDSQMKNVQENLENIKETFEIGKVSNKYQNTDEIVKELESYGFSPVRVPGCFVRPVLSSDNYDDNHYLANFINAIIQENPDGELVYITNKSLLDEMAQITPEVEEKIGFSFQSLFKDSIKEYVKPENVHFIDADGYIPICLEHSQGGIHCLCAEVPVIE